MATNNPTPAPEADVEGLIENLEALSRHVDPLAGDAASVIRSQAARIAELEQERDELRCILAKCCNALPNGAYCSPHATLEFMRRIPDETLLVTTALISRAEAAERETSRLRARLVEADRVIEPFALMADQVDEWQKGDDPKFAGQFEADDLRAARHYRQSEGE